MADRRRINPRDKGGGWFVDTTCFDCDVARQLAPGLIAEDADGLSYFTRPPATPDEEQAAWRAVLACPTGSIGAPAGAKPPLDVFPVEVAPRTWLTGYNARDSFGSNAYFIERDDGNLLVDAPRFVARVTDFIASKGGLAHILLTHRDDVADYAKYAERFEARVWIHRADLSAAPGATDAFDGDVDVAPGVRAVFTPGHTRGSAMFLVDDSLLFTGDSLYWCRETDDLNAFRDATWHSWEAQTEALARLAEVARFDHVLPGHGGRGSTSADDMRRRLCALVERMRAGTTTVAW